jgi:hypothetical protein
MPMRRHEAEAQRERLQRDDHNHTYLVTERSQGNWDVVRVNRGHGAFDLRAERGDPADPPPDPRPSLIRQIPPYGPPG